MLEISIALRCSDMYLTVQSAAGSESPSFQDSKGFPAYPALSMPAIWLGSCGEYQAITKRYTRLFVALFLTRVYAPLSPASRYIKHHNPSKQIFCTVKSVYDEVASI